MALEGKENEEFCKISFEETLNNVRKCFKILRDPDICLNRCKKKSLVKVPELIGKSIRFIMGCAPTATSLFM